MPESKDYSVWFDKEGTRWQYDPIWEGCEFVSSETPDDFCINITQYTGMKRNGVQVNLCSEHFEEMKQSST